MIAITLIVGGLIYFLQIDWVYGMWMIVVGLIIALMLGTTEGRNYGVWRVKRGTVEDVMNRDVVQIPPGMKVTDFINKVLNNNHHTSFPVVDNMRLHGMLLLEELKTVPREDWPRLEARDVMRPVNDAMFVNSSATIAQVNPFFQATGWPRRRPGFKRFHSRIREPARY